MYKYTNSFHNTAAASKYGPNDFRRAAEYRYAKTGSFYRHDLELILAAARRIRRKLCGVTGCTCATNWLGERR